MKKLKVNDMDKYQLTEEMKKVKEYILNPNSKIYDLSKEYYEELLNPPTDKDGFVHKYYLSDEIKILVEIFGSK